MFGLGRERAPFFVPRPRRQRGLRKLLGSGFVQAGDVDRVEAAELFDAAPPERLDAKAAAEEVLDGAAAENVLRQSFFPRTSWSSAVWTIAFQHPVFEQIGQLHLLVTEARSRSHSKRTAPQWQPPW